MFWLLYIHYLSRKKGNQIFKEEKSAQEGSGSHNKYNITPLQRWPWKRTGLNNSHKDICKIGHFFILFISPSYILLTTVHLPVQAEKLGSTSGYFMFVCKEIKVLNNNLYMHLLFFYQMSSGTVGPRTRLHCQSWPSLLKTATYHLVNGPTAAADH